MIGAIDPNSLFTTSDTVNVNPIVVVSSGNGVSSESSESSGNGGNTNMSIGATGSTATTCTGGGYWNPSLGICCAPLGTAPQADPCSILNNPSFLAAQAADVGPLTANGVPVSAGNGPGATELAEVAGYPQNVQTDAIDCWNNPGLVFVDSMMKTVVCPSASVNDNGIYTSAYTPGQLASMLAPSVTPAVETIGNAPVYIPATSPISGANSNNSVNGNQTTTNSNINNSTNTNGGSGVSTTATVPVSTNSNASTVVSTALDPISSFFSGLSETDWIIGGAALLGLMFLIKK